MDAAVPGIEIPFNKPFLTGKETHYIYEAIKLGKISGNGHFTKLCQDYLGGRYGFAKCLLTTSCTDALEMAAMLCGVGPGDEVVVPSFTFVSTALAFARQGARIVFADSRPDAPGIDVGAIESLLTERTKVVVPVHYAGVACDMDPILALCSPRGIRVVEDAAQAIDSYYKGRPLGGMGDVGCFSFHETKNVISGEGGLIAVNEKSFTRRSEIIWEKGTNRAEFFRGEVNKYGWVDTGSSFLPSEVIAAFLWAQLENIDSIQEKRKKLWASYHECLSGLAAEGAFELPTIPDFATNNGHMFYLVCRSLEERTGLIAHLRSRGILAVFHYQSLHSSEYYRERHDGRPLPNCDKFADRLVRLPLYHEIDEESVERVAECVGEYYAR